jgi:hypothetical protein
VNLKYPKTNSKWFDLQREMITVVSLNIKKCFSKWNTVDLSQCLTTDIFTEVGIATLLHPNI